MRHATAHLLVLLGALLLSTSACQEEPLPGSRSTASASATAPKPQGPSREQIEKEIAKLEKELADLKKRAARTYAMDTAKKINREIAKRQKRIEVLKKQLERAPR
jgi:septal ring factor EnvC (AmiA/AmiB activator)